jgi:hypothetical protein
MAEMSSRLRAALRGPGLVPAGFAFDALVELLGVGEALERAGKQA